MLIRRDALTAALAATGTDVSHYCLNSVQCEPGAVPRVVATDGHVLLVVTDAHGYPDRDFPIIPGAPFHGDPLMPVVVPSEILRALIATMPKNTAFPLLKAVQISRNGSEADTSFTVAATDLQAPRVATINTQDQPSFPTYAHILPAADRPSVSVSLSVEVLERVIKAAKAIAGSTKRARAQTIRFSLPTGKRDRTTMKVPGTPAVDATATTLAIAAVEPSETLGDVIAAVQIEITGADGITIAGVAMPCHT